MNRKLRVLYCCFHDTLRKSDVAALITAGFEVIPMRLTSNFAKTYKVNPDEYERDSAWRTSLSLSNEVIEQVRDIDIYRIFDERGQLDLQSSRVGEPEDVGKELINTCIDVIIMASFPHALAAVLGWFKGISCFRLYGHQNPDFRVLDWYFENFPLSKMKNFVQRSEHYFSLAIMHGTLTTEDKMILGRFPSLLSTYVDEQTTFGIRWKGENATKIIGTIISYIGEDPIWTKHYQEFHENFKGSDYVVLGKNNVAKLDNTRVLPYNDNRRSFLEELSKVRLFVHVGQTKQHSQYSPFESIFMGVPTLFLSSSGFANDIIERSEIPYSQLKNLGMCESWSELTAQAKKLSDNLSALIDLSLKQRIILEKTFGEKHSSDQAKEIYEKMNRQLQRVYSSSANVVSKRHSIFYAFIHKVQLEEESRLFVKANFNIVPMSAPAYMLAYHGEKYNDISSATNQVWFSDSTLPDWVIRRARQVDMITATQYHKIGILEDKYIEFLDMWFDAIYVPAHIPMALNILHRGYTGIVLQRYFGHYVDGWSRTAENQFYNVTHESLALFKNYYWMPSMPALTRYEAEEVAPRNRTILVQCFRDPSRILQKWKNENSILKIATAISLVDRDLKHYYDRFKQNIGHLPYTIFGKNQKWANQDPSVFGRLNSEEQLFDELVTYRVYVDVGDVDHHMHYTPLEAMIMGIPTLYMSKGGLGTEVNRVFNGGNIGELGACSSFDEMAERASKCLNSLEYARELSVQQRKVVKKLFNETVVLEQLEQLHTVIKQNNISRAEYKKKSGHFYKILNKFSLMDEPLILKMKHKLRAFPMARVVAIKMYNFIITIRASLQKLW